MMPHVPGDKLIIIGERNARQRAHLESMLAETGFARCLAVSSGIQLRERLRTFRNREDEVGLIIVGDNLPDFQLDECCLAVSSGDQGAGVPVIVLVDELPDPQGEKAMRFGKLSESGVSLVARPVRTSDFIPLVNICLILRNERCLRRLQEKQLLTELSERKIMEARCKYLVAHDELTGLANRRSLEKKLQLALYRCRSLGQQGALFYLDLDRFNIINDREGHETGDRLLVEVVSILHATVDIEHMAARIGADEFCIFVERVNRKDAMDLAERLRQALDGFRFVTDREGYHISASIGIALVQSQGAVNHASALIARAHQACDVAKVNGRNLVHVYTDEDTHAREWRCDIVWVPLIREALTENRFFLVFQPVVRVSDGIISHYEVLIRMRGRGSEIFFPNEFIPVAERTGLIHRIDLWVVEHAIDFLASLPEQQAHISLTVNLSGGAFQEQSLLPMIKKKLAATWVSASRIIFEITETSTVANYQETRDMIARIRALGCHFALDDFGAGFSSFDYIKRFPVDYLKIDGEFIKNLLHDETDRVLVKAMIDIARRLGKRTIAEYVENAKVLALLKKLGVDYAQGNLIGRPEPYLLPISQIAMGATVRSIASKAVRVK